MTDKVRKLLWWSIWQFSRDFINIRKNCCISTNFTRNEQTISHQSWFFFSVAVIPPIYTVIMIVDVNYYTAAANYPKARNSRKMYSWSLNFFTVENRGLGLGLTNNLLTCGRSWAGRWPLIAFIPNYRLGLLTTTRLHKSACYPLLPNTICGELPVVSLLQEPC